MELDALLAHYFKSTDLGDVSPEVLEEGCEQLTLDFALEQEGGRKFALWVLLEALGLAPSPEEGFKDHPDLMVAARKWLRATG